MGKNVVAEYVVRLGSELDNAGVQQILAALDTTKFKALGVTAAITGVTAAVYKFISSATQQEFALKKLATQQKKNAEALNAQQKALNAMGMTLNDIKKDKALKSTYDDIVKFNKELELPNVDHALGKIRELQAAFWKMKSAVNMTIQSIGRQVMINLEDPIKRITGYMNNISDWIKKNFNSITTKVSTVLTAFAKGVIGIGEGFGNIMKLIDKMPSGIKAVGTAIGVVVGLVKSGPIGQILAAITAIGDIIHDYENYQWNKENGYQQGDENYVANLNDKFKIWEDYENQDFSGIATKIIQGLTNALNGAWSSQDGQTSLGVIFNGEDGNGGILGSIKGWLEKDENKQSLTELGTAFITFITKSIKEVGGLFGGAIGGVVEAIFGDGVVSDEIFNDQQAGTAFAGAIGGLIGGFASEIGKGGKFNDAFLKGLGGGALGLIIGALTSSLTMNEDGSINWDSTLDEMVNAIKPVAETFWAVFGKAIEAVDNIGSFVFTGIANSIKGMTGGEGLDAQILAPLQEAFEILGKDDSIFGNAISEGLAAGIASGSGFVGIISGLTSLITNALTNPTEFREELESLGNALGEFWGLIWEGEYVDLEDKSKGRKGGMLKELILGKDGKGGIAEMFTNIANDIAGWLQPVFDAIETGINNMWIRIYAKLPGWVKQMFGIVNPNSSNVVEDANGNITVTDTTGKTTTEKNFKSENGDSLAQVLKDYEDLYYIGDNGNIKFKASEMYYGNLAQQIFGTSAYSKWSNVTNKAWEEGSPDVMRFMFSKMREAMDMPDQKAAEKMLSKLSDEVNAGYRTGDIRSFITEKYGWNFDEHAPKVPVEGELDAESLQTQASNLNLKTDIQANIVTDGENGEKPGKAWGARVGHEATYRVGEDGTEYIIPITKPERAAALIKQMFGEMGSAAVSKIVGDLGIGQTGTNGASLSSASNALGGMTMANTYNINAPVNINVAADGANAKDVGTQVYSLAERNLVKTLMGVFG